MIHDFSMLRLKGLVLFVVCLSLDGFAKSGDIRLDLQKSAAKEDPHFPDGKTVLLTHFSIACQLETSGGPIYVVDQRAVVAGMLAPRGQNQISFFNWDLKFLASLRYVASRPLWCEGAKVFLFGGWDGAMPGDTRCASGTDCNVVGWSTETNGFKLFHEKRYGSSGGIEDP